MSDWDYSYTREWCGRSGSSMRLSELAPRDSSDWDSSDYEELIGAHRRTQDGQRYSYEKGRLRT